MIKDTIEDATRTGSSIDLYLDGWRCLEDRKGVKMFTASEYNAARSAVILAQKCSISFIQRKLRIGYNRAAYLVEALQNEGIVSVPDSAGRMTVLVKWPLQEDSGS